SYVDSPIVKVLVGAGLARREFEVQQVLICSRSEFLAKEVSDQSLGPHNGLANLESEDPDTFERYVEFLDGISFLVAPYEHIVLCNVYVLAHKLDDTKTQEKIIEYMKEDCE
ncbi:hypothetical protein BCR34DRAFT_483362, partial [Clohesyomyces aquaticus]